MPRRSGVSPNQTNTSTGRALGSGARGRAGWRAGAVCGLASRGLAGGQETRTQARLGGRGQRCAEATGPGVPGGSPQRASVPCEAGLCGYLAPQWE